MAERTKELTPQEAYKAFTDKYQEFKCDVAIDYDYLGVFVFPAYMIGDKNGNRADSMFCVDKIDGEVRSFQPMSCAPEQYFKAVRDPKNTYRLGDTNGED